MRFLDLTLYNFKPYYGEEKILLFDRTRSDKPMTLNIGPTGHGKTSISEGLMWCLFGERYGPGSQWESWVNELCIEVAEEQEKEDVEIFVKLHGEIDGEEYDIVRTATYNIKEKQRKDKSKLRILKKGKPIKEDPDGFVNKHFVTVDLMKYFVFDADDLLDLFENNQERTIKDNINKILNVEILDKMISALETASNIYNHEIQMIEEKLPSATASELKQAREDKRKKEDAIVDLNKKIEKLKKKQKKLFSKSPTGMMKEFSELVDKREKLRENVRKLNEEFLDHKCEDTDLSANLHLVFLVVVLKSISQQVQEEKPSKTRFEASLDIIRSVVNGHCEGIAFPNTGNIALIKTLDSISSDSLMDLDILDFPESEANGRRFAVYPTIKENRERGARFRTTFLKYKEEMDSMMSALVKTRNRIDQIGDNEKNKALKKKYDAFMELDVEIEEMKRRIKDIKGKLKNTKERINDLQNKLKLGKQQKERIKLYEERRKASRSLVKFVRKTKERFMSRLLKDVNNTASDLLRKIVKDSNRFHSIEVTPDYEMIIKKIDGGALEEDQINKGNLQIALMSFFLALSEHIGREIPYVIDDPLMRFDPGHDKRLVTQLGRGKKQIVMHLIPGKEYTPESYEWLNEFINTQNWIARDKYGRYATRRSEVTEMPPSSLIEYKIDDL